MSNPPLMLRIGHISMQRNDAPVQQAADAERIFRRGRNLRRDWITGTEAGKASDGLASRLAAAARRNGYRLFWPRDGSDVWIAVRIEVMRPGTVTSGYIPVLKGEFGSWAPRGLRWVSFEHVSGIGRIHVGCAHYVTGGAKNNNLNRQIAQAIGGWATRAGRGSDLVFYHGDQNLGDGVVDTFFGQDLTSAWDELGKHENTGSGNIDVIASYDKDMRVRARFIRALDDSEMPLNTDHFMVEAGYSVERN